jgi:hypothetical protein
VPEYLVEIKRSARRSNAAVGSLVCQHGVRHRFDSRETAESWAADLAEDASTVWIRAANPDDSSGVDAYLIGWLHRTPTPTPTDGESPGDQAWLADFGWNGTDGGETDRVGSEPRHGGERITDWLASE